MGAPSMWWPTPADPFRWFDLTEVAASKRFKGSVLPRFTWGSGPDTSAARLPVTGRRLAGLTELAEQAGLPATKFSVAPGLVGHNACCDGTDIVLSASALGLTEVLRHWLVAHELAHIRRGHARRLAVLAGVLVVVVLALGVALHLFAGLAGVVVAQLTYLFVARAYERQADIDAAQLVERPDIRDLTHMVATSGQDLAPSRMRKMLAAHPAPAERLELLSRL